MLLSALGPVSSWAVCQQQGEGSPQSKDFNGPCRVSVTSSLGKIATQTALVVGRDCLVARHGLDSV